MKLITLKIFIVLAAGFACINAASKKEEFFKSIDKKLDKALEKRSVAKYAKVKEEILKWCKEPCYRSAALWRLALCCYFIIELDKHMPAEDKMALMNEGYNYADQAVCTNNRDPEAHKWMAIFSDYRGSVLGSTGTDQYCGITYPRYHITEALMLNPDDPVLHYLYGEYQVKIVKLLNNEKFLAAKVFTNYPNWTFKDAIKSFLRADELFKRPRTDIRAAIAYSYYADGNLTKAREWLQKAEDVGDKNFIDEKTAKQIADLRKSLNV